MAAYALVLFDVDGCTAIVDSKKLVLEGKDLVNGQQCYMKFGAEKLKVEILQLSDSKRELNKFEDEWSTSHRSMALDKEKRKRRNKPDGYLAVWPQDVDDVVPAAEDLPDPIAETQDLDEDHIDAEHNETEEPKTVKPTKKSKETKEKTKEAKEKPKEKTGSKGRKITVLFEGGGDYSTDVAAPKRAPYYLEELSADERDLINLQVEQYKRGLETETTQTEAVVILGPNDVLPPLTSDAFQNILDLLKELKKGQQDMKVQVEELKKEQQETKSQVQDLTREVVALKERPSSRNSVGSLLTTNELHELLINSENNSSVETAQGLEEGLSKRQEPTQKNKEDKENEKITVHLGVTETMPVLRRPKRTTASTATSSTTENVTTSATTTASSPSTSTSGSNSENITTSAPTISSSTSAPTTTTSSTSAPTTNSSTSASTTSSSTSGSTTSSSTSASITNSSTSASTTSSSTSASTTSSSTSASITSSSTSTSTTSSSTSASTTSSSTSASITSSSTSTSTTSYSTSASTTSNSTSSPTSRNSTSASTTSDSTSAPTSTGTTASSNGTSNRETTTTANSSTSIPINTNTAIVPINTFSDSFAESTITLNSFSSLVPNSNSFDNIQSPYQLPVVPNSMMMNLSTSPSNLRTVFSLPSISNSTSPNAPINTALTTINMQQAATILPSALLGNSPSPSTNKKAIQFKCFPGQIIEIDGPEDVPGTPEDAEFRIRQKTSLSAAASACSKANFGWILVQTIYRQEELVGRNFYGNRKNIAAISPRRRHAIEHAVAEVYGSYDPYLKEAISGINTGLRRLRSRRLPFTSLENV